MFSHFARGIFHRSAAIRKSVAAVRFSAAKVCPLGVADVAPEADQFNLLPSLGADGGIFHRSFSTRADSARSGARVHEENGNGTLTATREAKDFLEQAKKERDDAKKERDDALKEWTKAPADAKDVRLEIFNDARNALELANKAVDRAQSAYTTLLTGNGAASSKLPADHPDVVAATAQWKALLETEIKPHTDVFPDLEVLDENGKPFNFNVLEVTGTLPFASISTDNATVVERDFYPLIKKIVVDRAGSAFRVLLRGAPGTGKSGPLGMYLVHGAAQLMEAEGEHCRIQQIVLTSRENGCVVYRRDGSVDVWSTLSNEALNLAYREDSMWLMDEEEHGAFLRARGLTFLLASADPANYKTYWKKSQQLNFIPPWDSDGRLSREGLPLELEALVRVTNADNTSTVTLEDALHHYFIAGPLPRDIIEDFSRAKAEIDHVIGALSIEDVMKLTRNHKEMVNLHYDHRAAYPHINRETLQSTNAMVFTSEYLRGRLLDKQSKDQWTETLTAYQTQAQLSGSRRAVGKMFEELAFHYITVVSPVNDGFLLEESGQEAQELRFCDEECEVGTASTFLFNFDNRKPYALKADNTTESGIDFLFASAKGDLTAANVTFNMKHELQGRHLAQRFEKQCPSASAELKFVWITDRITGPRMKKKTLVDDRKEPKQQRNDLLARVKQYVVALPIDFADNIRFDQFKPSAKEASVDQKQ